MILSRTGRLVYWRVNSKCPYSVSQINSMLSNNHLIPANRKVRKGIKKLKKKDVVYMEGYFVNVEINKNVRLQE